MINYGLTPQNILGMDTIIRIPLLILSLALCFLLGKLASKRWPKILSSALIPSIAIYIILGWIIGTLSPNQALNKKNLIFDVIVWPLILPDIPYKEYFNDMLHPFS